MANRLFIMAGRSHLQPINTRSKHLRHHRPNMEQPNIRHHHHLQVLLRLPQLRRVVRLPRLWAHHRCLQKASATSAYCNGVAFYVYCLSERRFIISSRWHQPLANRNYFAFYVYYDYKLFNITSTRHLRLVDPSAVKRNHRAHQRQWHLQPYYRQPASPRCLGFKHPAWLPVTIVPRLGRHLLSAGTAVERHDHRQHFRPRVWRHSSTGGCYLAPTVATTTETTVLQHRQQQYLRLLRQHLRQIQSHLLLLQLHLRHPYQYLRLLRQHLRRLQQHLRHRLWCL